MTQEDKELLLIDISARVPYGLKASIRDTHCVQLNTVNWYQEIGIEDYTTNLYDISEAKPYLFPLSSLSDKQKEELKEEKLKDTKILASLLKENDKNKRGTGILYYGQDWCNKNHFDYRGLIEKGLAIDATNLGIYE